MLATVQDSPSYPARVLALEEEGLGLSILESEDLAVTAHVQLTLEHTKSHHQNISPNLSQQPQPGSRPTNTGFKIGVGYIPCQGRSSHR